jgi:hypothetical protein
MERIDPHAELEKLRRALPYNLTEDQLVLEPGTDNADLGACLEWLGTHADEDEATRILDAALILHKAHPEHRIAACIETAIIWERG